MLPSSLDHAAAEAALSSETGSRRRSSQRNGLRGAQVPGSVVAEPHPVLSLLLLFLLLLLLLQVGQVSEPVVSDSGVHIILRTG